VQHLIRIGIERDMRIFRAGLDERAVLVAGADALIMSLWKVDDAATNLLMTNFYTNWIKLGNKQKAFKQAQLQLMAKFKEPYYWGAFVMMGM
jgi:CHAT domain-containing protein